MTLKELLKMIDPYHNIQIVNSMTLDVYTDVTYLAGGSAPNIENIELHERDTVHGISASIADDGEPYLRITLNSVV